MNLFLYKLVVRGVMAGGVLVNWCGESPGGGGRWRDTDGSVS